MPGPNQAIAFAARGILCPEENAAARSATKDETFRQAAAHCGQEIRDYPTRPLGPQCKPEGRAQQAADEGQPRPAAPGNLR